MTTRKTVLNEILSDYERLIDLGNTRAAGRLVPLLIEQVVGMITDGVDAEVTDAAAAAADLVVAEVTGSPVASSDLVGDAVGLAKAVERDIKAKVSGFVDAAGDKVVGAVPSDVLEDATGLLKEAEDKIKAVGGKIEATAASVVDAIEQKVSKKKGASTDTPPQE